MITGGAVTIGNTRVIAYRLFLELDPNFFGVFASLAVFLLVNKYRESKIQNKIKNMLKIETISAADQATFLQKKEIADFLFVQLEQYGDPLVDIMKCLDYALDQAVDKGGFVVLARENGKIVGAVVINKTGMSGYIPENILVYIAVDASQRGKGVGKKLMTTAIDFAKGT
jgi:[ribosomal protein S18]-alanine N-acetyltransferase